MSSNLEQYSVCRYIELNRSGPSGQTDEGRSKCCTQCMEYGIKLNKMQLKNAKIKKKYEALQREFWKLKRSFTYIRDRKKNRVNNENEEPEPEERCEVCFETTADLDQHICMDQSEVNCDYCSASFKSTIDLGIHLSDAKHPDTQLFKCDKCTMAFAAASLLQFHQSSEHTHTSIEDTHKRTYFECYLCKIKIRSWTETRTHLKQHVAARDKRCEICNEKLTSNELRWHLCETGGMIKCDYCNRSFNVTTEILQHLANEHDNKIMYRCRICKRYFGMEHLRDLHEKQHEQRAIQPKPIESKARPFTCNVCNRGFTSSNTLKCHESIHQSM